MGEALASVSASPYLVRVETNNRLHLRFEVGGRTLDDGRCGIDDNWVRADLSVLESADPGRLCRFCFPASGD